MEIYGGISENLPMKDRHVIVWRSVGVISETLPMKDRHVIVWRSVGGIGVRT